MMDLLSMAKQMNGSGNPIETLHKVTAVLESIDSQLKRLNDNLEKAANARSF